MFVAEHIIGVLALVCLLFTIFLISIREYRRSLIGFAATVVSLASFTGYHNLGAFCMDVLAALYFGTGSLAWFRALEKSEETGWRFYWKFATAVLEWLLFLGAIWHLLTLVLNLGK